MRLCQTLTERTSAEGCSQYNQPLPLPDMQAAWFMAIKQSFFSPQLAGQQSRSHRLPFPLQTSPSAHLGLGTAKQVSHEPAPSPQTCESSMCFGEQPVSTMFAGRWERTRSHEPALCGKPPCCERAVRLVPRLGAHPQPAAFPLTNTNLHSNVVVNCALHLKWLPVLPCL